MARNLLAGTHMQRHVAIAGLFAAMLTTACGSGGTDAPAAGPPPAPAPVAACDSVGSAGTWEDITPAAFRSPSNMETLSVVVNPQSPNIVFATAGNITNANCPAGESCPKRSAGIHVSTDCGAHFTPLSMGPDNAFSGGDLWSLQIDPQHPEVMYTMNGYGGPPTLFKSVDSGKTWVNLFTSGGTVAQAFPPGLGYGGFVRSFDIDRNEPAHLVVAFHETCWGPVAHGAANGVMCLAETRDGGATWSLFEGPVPPTSADGGAPVILGSNALVYASPDGAWFIDDAARATGSWQSVVDYARSSGFWGINRSGAYVAPDGTAYLPSGQGTFYSRPGAGYGKTWTKIGGSPKSSVVHGDGQQLFSSWLYEGGVPIYSAPLDGSAGFTAMKTASPMASGAGTFTYDPVRHLLYGANWGGGLWRIKLQ